MNNPPSSQRRASPLKAVAEFLREEDGPTAVEYAVMLALIAAVVAVSATNLGTTVATQFTNTATAVN